MSIRESDRQVFEQQGIPVFETLAEYLWAAWVANGLGISLAHAHRHYCRDREIPPQYVVSAASFTDYIHRCVVEQEKQEEQATNG